MMIHEITAKAGRYKSRKRVGRGRASGVGKTAGRGHNGAQSRAGFSRRHSFEGGQMPLFRRIAKRGFENTRFRTEFWIVNLGDIVKHPAFAAGGEVSAAKLVAAGLIRDEKRPLKILGDLGSDQALSVKLEVVAQRVSDPARKLIEAAGGNVNELGTRRDRVRGVDRNSEDRSPTNLNKKPKRRAAKVFDTAPAGAKAAKGGKAADKKADAKAKPDAKAQKAKGEKKQSKADAGKSDGADK